MESVRSIPRREVIKQLLIASGGLLIGWKSPDISNTDQMILGKNAKRTLQSFIKTVVPGVDVSHPGITELFYDPFYGFAKYRMILLFSLANKSQSLFGTRNFEGLSIEKRAAVIRNGLNNKGKIGQLYSAAVFASQATIYTGFYKEPESCDIIRFTSRFGFDQISYPDPDRFLGRAITQSGNYH